jgi:hypothetical protein
MFPEIGGCAQVCSAQTQVSGLAFTFLAVRCGLHQVSQTAGRSMVSSLVPGIVNARIVQRQGA